VEGEGPKEGEEAGGTQVAVGEVEVLQTGGGGGREGGREEREESCRLLGTRCEWPRRGEEEKEEEEEGRESWLPARVMRA